MFGLEPIEIVAIFAGAFAIISFICNMYLCCKFKLLRSKMDNIDKMGKLAKLEFPKLEAAAHSKETQAQIDLVSDLISSIIDTAGVSDKSNLKNSNKMSNFRSTPLGGRGSPF